MKKFEDLNFRTNISLLKYNKNIKKLNLFIIKLEKFEILNIKHNNVIDIKFIKNINIKNFFLFNLIVLFYQN